MYVGITGSYKQGRDSEKKWPLASGSSLETFAAACRSIGAALALQKANLVVGSEGKSTADRYVVEGYLQRVTDGCSIIVIRPRTESGSQDRHPPFHDLYQSHSSVFLYQEANEVEWRHTRHEFIDKCDAMVALCGGDGTYQTGLEARLGNCRLVPVGSFGGASRQLWDQLVRTEVGRKHNALKRLGSPWAPALAEVVIDALELRDPLRIFLIYGHSEHKDAVVSWLAKESQFQLVVLAEEFTGRTLSEMLRDAATDVHGAVALITADDIGFSMREPDRQEKRARQNVWLEIGWFYGALGTSRVFALVENGVEIPSNLGGMFLQRFKADPLEQKAQLQKFLQRLVTQFR